MPYLDSKWDGSQGDDVAVFGEVALGVGDGLAQRVQQVGRPDLAVRASGLAARAVAARKLRELGLDLAPPDQRVVRLREGRGDELDQGADMGGAGLTGLEGPEAVGSGQGREQLGDVLGRVGDRGRGPVPGEGAALYVRWHDVFSVELVLSLGGSEPQPVEDRNAASAASRNAATEEEPDNDVA